MLRFYDCDNTLLKVGDKVLMIDEGYFETGKEGVILSFDGTVIKVDFNGVKKSYYPKRFRKKLDFKTNLEKEIYELNTMGFR